MIEKIHGCRGTYLNLYPNGSYDPTEFERASLASDICICRIHDKELQVLLVKRPIHPDDVDGGKWSILGGFVHINSHETSEEAAYRTLNENFVRNEVESLKQQAIEVIK